MMLNFIRLLATLRLLVPTDESNVLHGGIRGQEALQEGKKHYRFTVHTVTSCIYSGFHIHSKLHSNSIEASVKNSTRILRMKKHRRKKNKNIALRGTGNGSCDASNCIHGTCNGSLCVCLDGWKGSGCNEDVDECLGMIATCDPVSEICSNVDGSYYCFPRGFPLEGEP